MPQLSEPVDSAQLCEQRVEQVLYVFGLLEHAQPITVHPWEVQPG